MTDIHESQFEVALIRCSNCGCPEWVRGAAYTYCAYCKKPKVAVAGSGHA